MQAAGGGEGGLGRPQPVRQRGDDRLPSTRSSLSTRGASTATASSAPLPQTPQEEVV